MLSTALLQCLPTTHSLAEAFSKGQSFAFTTVEAGSSWGWILKNECDVVPVFKELMRDRERENTSFVLQATELREIGGLSFRGERRLQRTLKC